MVAMPSAASTVEVHAAAEEAVGVEPPEHEIGVGHRGLGAAAAVAGGTRIGAGAHRADMQAAALVAPGERAAARADLDDVDHRQLHRLAGELVADHVALLDRRQAVGDQRGLGGGAAHVEADGARDAEAAGKMAGADHAGDGARLHHRDRLAARLRDRHGAAVRAHDRDLAGEFLAARELLETAEIAADARADIGVEHGGRGALVFAELAQDLVAERHEHLRAEAAQRRTRSDLVRRVGVGMQETHRHRLDAGRHQFARERLDARQIERCQDIAGCVHALAHLVGEIARDQRTRAVEMQVEGVGPVPAADRVDIAEAFGGDQCGVCAAALEHRVDRDGRAMQQFARRRDIAAGKFQRRRRAFGRVGGNGECLGRKDRAVVVADEVGERAADIDADDAQNANPRRRSSEYGPPPRNRK
jgi:hypothetical protein